MPPCHISTVFCNNVIPPAEIEKKVNEAHYKYWDAKVAFMNITQGVLFIDNQNCTKFVVSHDFFSAVASAVRPKDAAITNSPYFLLLLFISFILL
jgi:hypothetical protein